MSSCRSSTPPWYHEHRGSGLDWDKVYGHGGTQSRSPLPTSPSRTFQLPLRRQPEDRVLATAPPNASNNSENLGTLSRTNSDQAVQTEHISRRLTLHRPARSISQLTSLPAIHCELTGLLLIVADS